MIPFLPFFSKVRLKNKVEVLLHQEHVNQLGQLGQQNH